MGQHYGKAFSAHSEAVRLRLNWGVVVGSPRMSFGRGVDRVVERPRATASLPDLRSGPRR